VKRIFSFALGNIWKWKPSINRNDLIDIVRELDVSGVEITFSTKEELYAFKLSNPNKNWLRSLDYVTIHAPFNLLAYSKNEVLKQLDCLFSIYENIDAQNVIIHPKLNTKHSEILKNKEFNISIENLPPRFGISVSDLQKFMDTLPTVTLCLDVAHAYLWSKYETSYLTSSFENRISQIHFSGTYKRKDHQSLRIVSKDFLHSIQPILELNVPIIIEENMNIQSLEYVKEEIEYIKSLFKIND